MPTLQLQRNRKMSYRALIFDDQPEIRRILWSLFDGRGYEVFTFPHPAICPLNQEDFCPCPTNQACADVILSDLNMPVQNGLDFLEKQIHKGCRCRHFALMSGDLAPEDIARAASLGITVFLKPFKLTDITAWLDQVEKEIDPQRGLSQWFLESLPEVGKKL
jgi:CheY-like chemotaxis protein